MLLPLKMLHRLSPLECRETDLILSVLQKESLRLSGVSFMWVLLLVLRAGNDLKVFRAKHDSAM